MTRLALNCVGFACLLVLGPTDAIAQDLAARNTSRYLGNDQWEWTVFLTGSREILSSVQSVEYRLHPTFSPSVVVVQRQKAPLPPYEVEKPFGLTRTGWGVFEIVIKVTFEDGRLRGLKHMLSFSARDEPECIDLSLDQEHYQMVSDPRFKDLFVYVGDIKDKWRKIPANVILFLGDRSSWSNSAKIEESEFNKKIAGAPNQWRLKALKGGEGIQFEYDGKPYVLSVTQLRTTAFGDSMSLRICEKR